MGVFDRLKRIIKGKAEDFDGEEAPEITVDRLLGELRTRLRESRLNVSMAVRDLRRVERQMHQSEAEAKDWMAKAREAIIEKKDERARDYLGRKKTAAELASELRKEFEIHQKSVRVLKKDLIGLEDKIRTFTAKRAALMSKKRRLEAVQRFRQKRPDLSDDEVNSALGRLEEKVDILQLTEGSVDSSDPLEAEFRKLEKESEADRAALAKLDDIDDIEDLKRLLLGADGEKRAEDAEDVGKDESEDVEVDEPESDEGKDPSKTGS